MDAVLKFLNGWTNFKKGFILELFICEMIFLFGSKRRVLPKIPYAVLFIAVWAVYFVSAYFIPLLPVPSLMAIIDFTISMLAAWAVFDIKINRIIFFCVAGYAVQNLAVNINNVFFDFVTVNNGWGKFFIRLFIKIAVYVGSYFAFARRSRDEELNIRHIRLYVISLLTIVVSSVLFALVRSSGHYSREISLAMALCGLLALMLQFSEFHSGNLNKEMVSLEWLLRYEQEQHDLKQDTIDLINIKCHDLKKQVTALKELLGDRADELIGESERAISVYDDMVLTGNKNLDIIVAEEKAYAKKCGATIDVMADGAQIDFMSPADIYSLFSNALSNAVEAVASEQDRCIRFDIHRSGEYVCVSVVNACTRDIKFVNGMPLTSKSDKNFHGYGARSMEYIVKKYGGNMVIAQTDGTFTVKIIFKPQARHGGGGARPYRLRAIVHNPRALRAADQVPAAILLASLDHHLS